MWSLGCTGQASRTGAEDLLEQAKHSRETRSRNALKPSRELCEIPPPAAWRHCSVDCPHSPLRTCLTLASYAISDARRRKIRTVLYCQSTPKRRHSDICKFGINQKRSRKKRDASARRSCLNHDSVGRTSFRVVLSLFLRQRCRTSLVCLKPDSSVSPMPHAFTPLSL